ncbi:Ketoglutarate semialdehyde dehydrogenase [Polaromonas sp. CG9_12]|nr:Ketoglutarate semialdehyde dehydrogenase [Polaromonas sp. CG9_12]
MNLHPEVDAAVALACDAAGSWAVSDGTRRAALLDGLAEALENDRAALVVLADSETHLGMARLTGELDRTCFQLRGFASLARDGGLYGRIDDAAIAGPPPAGRPHLLRVRVPVGPVAMFSASNFPFAFSVLGGDTASALAAGCPVVVKGHPAHIGLSRRVHQLAQEVLRRLELPAGLVGHLDIDSHAAGLELVGHPGIQAVAFTGSLAGGLALGQKAQSRSQPIAFYGELGSVNPVVVLPEAIGNGADALAKTLAASITQGAGQFCTSPGLVLMLDTAEARAFVEKLAAEVDQLGLHPMLSERIGQGYAQGVSALRQHPDVRALTSAAPAQGLSRGFVGVVSAASFMADKALRHEVFGASCVCVMAASLDELCAALQAVGGSLTTTLLGADGGTARDRQIFRVAQNISGRVLFKGMPTGVAVTLAQHHGGPWPASTQPLFTSVGFTASDRFLRPVALQDAPGWLLERQGVPA